jgi:predicted Zn-dependent peptidase
MNVALENFKTAIFENSVYSHTNLVLEKTLPKVTRNDVMKYYDKIFDSKNIIVSINGNVNREEMIQAFGNIFSDKKQPLVDFSKFSVTKMNNPQKISKTIKDLQTAWLFLGWQTAGVQNKKDFVTLKVINTILGSGMSSRLFRNIREADGLAYQLGTAYSPKMLGGIFMGYIGTNPTTLEKSREMIIEEITKLKSEFVSDTELQNAKDRLKGGFILALETNSEKASNIGYFEAYGFGYDFLNSYIKIIDSITASDIVKTANKYFTQNIVQSDVR